MLASCLCTGMQAQVQTRQDTLPPAVKEGYRVASGSVNGRLIEPADFSMMAMPTGSADFVKFVQTLSGVTGGADGSSAYYVRGGNQGGNLQTLDGVPIYGKTHLLGLSSAYSPDIISSAEFQVGGFTSEEGNLSSSHIKMRSRDGSFDKFSAQAEASNFLLGGSVSTPLKHDKVSLSASARFSPVKWVYDAAISGLVGDDFSLKLTNAAVYDIYAKVKYRIRGDHALSLSVFNSLDSYRYSHNRSSEDSMSWSNLIASLQYDTRWGLRSKAAYSASFNHFSNSQGMVKKLGKTKNDLLMRSTIDEMSASGSATTQFGRQIQLQYGLKARLARFNPGSARALEGNSLLIKSSSPLVDHFSTNFTGTVHGQVQFGDFSKNMLRLASRLNYNSSARFSPEGSLMARLRLFKHTGIELTADRLVQYYHTLEGIPLGWSLDMIVPTSEKLRPEIMQQVYGGFYSDMGNHHVSIGCYYKDLRNVVWFLDATKLFDSAMSGWSDNIEVGTGKSMGVEFFYEKTGRTVDWKVAYTLSKTDRTFPGVNHGIAFPAKFDRRHVLNVTASLVLLSRTKVQWGLSGLFTFQSGHRETVPSGSFVDDNPITGRVEQDFYLSLHNFLMPPYIRLDLNSVVKLVGRKHPQEIGVGIFNVLNRHNPSMLSYYAAEREWKQISLLPIMPSLRYVISF